ncbi:MAG: dTDP-glucose 4,6-dehydratase [Desulfobacterales bacterium]|jgi:dTDP-glucose 4,6-dehydratase|nr:dTDP-glucose 4,6-dehydratase [Desulfobacteraceae bacterium]MBT7086412.1 dTDP-glucose 4,6-dehydratase [Desulfobacterales bacterium]
MEEKNNKKILVTGGAGFIGTNFIRNILKTKPFFSVVNFDALTYAGNISNFADISSIYDERYRFVHGDIRDAAIIGKLFDEEDFDIVVHFAAESHVDRSISGPEVFIDTNVNGTFRLLEASLKKWNMNGKPDDFRFIHVSTDEVYGSLGDTGYFTETTPYDPSSPYSASKAASDHFVKAYYRTFGLPAIVTNCSNNYGSFQFPEKLIPLIILNIMERKDLPVYGDGKNVRDWLYVIDHCDAILTVLEKGKQGETYNIGGGAEYPNIEIVELLCDLMDKKLNRSASRELIRFVNDRPGHDMRYAIDASKIKNELGWSPRFRFEEAIIETVDWYLNNTDWVDSVRSGEYRHWIEKNYSDRSVVE